MKFFATIAALAFFAAVTRAQILNCNRGYAVADLHISYLTFTPNPVCVGQPVCVTVTGNLLATIEDDSSGALATLSITGKYLGRVVYSDTAELCTLINCPVDTNTTTINACVTVTPNAPVDLPVILDIIATNGNGNLIFDLCAVLSASNCSS